ncbi:asparagine synthase (glutamine-hydrolyzing) [Kutzneria albida]|uniref:asparagine synthase (glutamine-hydrolyzing) n=1 Tax=Kutzneria albida DSM 43870 TaxID=1449976 RepID=W5WEL4_9PSEU|nr:asparagine synthase (glutamine-hydrolyzing) [Kutzneria albida]AHH99046.1 hypothetical protein KALB_5685 [Kutzneria albida DSM 43870]
MCGITGWVAFHRDLSREQGALEAMTGTMANRGPDASGTWVDRQGGHAALGHRRLAVVDVEGGVQPMAVDTPTGTVAMVYSGEVYNYTELREELRRRGHTFRTASDTEVVLHGYLEWGRAVAEHLNGMYAFAVWDARAAALVMVRDRMGVKPLYYYPTDDGVLFGSEPKAILANPLAAPVVDLDSLRELFGFIKNPGHAVWAGMREVKPGTVTTVDVNGIHEATYWSLPVIEHGDGQDATVAHVRELLEDIVARQLVSDVPRGALLSGGLDSSAITALSAEHLAVAGEKLHSFAVDFTGQGENFAPDAERHTHDMPFAHEVAARADTVHTDMVLDSGSLAVPGIRRAVITARDVPAGTGDTDTSLYQLFREIQQHVTVALSGESADELFGGYRWHHELRLEEAATFPWIAFSGHHHGRDGHVLRPELRAALDVQGYVRDHYATAVAEVEHLPGDDEQARRRRVVNHLGLTRFLRMMLDRKDRLSMAVGLEVRVPFCDHRLVEYVYNAPWSMKTFDGREKSLLRAAVRDVVPASVVQRVKSAYPSVQAPDYLAAVRGQAARLLHERDHPVFELVHRLWLRAAVEADPGQVDVTTRSGLERCLNLAEWLEVYRPRLSLS